MVALFKGLFPALLLTLVVCLILGSNGSTGGFLFIRHVFVSGGTAFATSQYSFYWSWPLFISATLLGFFIFKMLE